MHTRSETTSAEALSLEEQAVSLINQITEEQTQTSSVSPAQLATRIEIAAALLPENAQGLVHQHTAGLHDLHQSAVIRNLEDGVGGQFDGSEVAIATETILVDQSRGIDQTRAQMDEVDRHEAYHAEHGHLQPLKTAESAEGSTIVTIGGQALDFELLTEAVTVEETGDKFVSGGYRAFVRKLHDAVAVSSVTYAQVRDALNQRDLTAVDDETVNRKKIEEGKPAPVMAG